MGSLSAIIIAGLLMIPTTRSHEPYPPTWKSLIKIAQCEQPSRDGGGWYHIAWHQDYNYSFAGGMGMTLLNWSRFKDKDDPTLMSKATPVEQLWAAYRLARWVQARYGNPWIAWDCYNFGYVKLG